MKIKHRLLSLLAAVTILSSFATQSVHAAEVDGPAVIGALFYSDTCGSCKVLDPKITAARETMADSPVLFVTFDHSNEATKNQAILLADRLGLEEIYASQKKASGFLLLIDAKTGEVIETITKSASAADIEASLAKAIQS